MLNLSEHIHHLLKRHSQVGVPGLGLFKQERIPARFDKESRSFVPPRRFVTLLSHDADGSLLLDNVAALERLTPDEAREWLDNSVNRLLADLEERATVTLEGIGYLQYTDGALSLTGVDENYAGLEPVKEFLIAEEEEMHQLAEGLAESSPEATQPVNTTITETTAYTETQEEETVSHETQSEEGTSAQAFDGTAVAPLNDSLIGEAVIEEEYPSEIKDTPLSEAPYEVITDPVHEEPEIQPKKSFSWVWLVSGIILVGIVFVAWWYADQRRVSSVGPVGGNDSVERSVQKDSLAEKAKADSIEAARLSALRIDSLRKDSLAADSLNRLKGKVSYEIIVGSFPDVPKAEEYVARMNNQGYHMRVILSKMPGNLKKVSCGSFLREDEAYKALAKVQRTFAKDAWIARIEN